MNDRIWRRFPNCKRNQAHTVSMIPDGLHIAEENIIPFLSDTIGDQQGILKKASYFESGAPPSWTG